MPRRHGFQLPYHPLQICAWAAVLLMLFLSFFVVQRSLSPTLQVVFLCLYSPTQFAVLVLGGVLTGWDPTDPVVYRHREALEIGTGFPEDQYSMICTACGTNVSAEAKHCSRCDRCVSSFDHHCKWLNNCIGECNYRSFCALLASLWLCCTAQLTFALVALTQESEETVIQGSAEKTLLVLDAVLAGIALLGVSHLSVFHVWLRCKGLTTYEFIKRRRERRVQIGTMQQLPHIDKVTQETQADHTRKADETDITHKIDDSALIATEGAPTS